VTGEIPPGAGYYTESSPFGSRYFDCEAGAKTVSFNYCSTSN
jgi:hypothetical protein